MKDSNSAKKIVKTLVWPVALYGCETWTLRDAECKRLDAFEMWVWRRMEKVSYKDRVTNEKVLKNVGESRCLLDKIRSRKRNWVGHVLRGSDVSPCPWSLSLWSLRTNFKSLSLSLSW